MTDETQPASAGPDSGGAPETAAPTGGAAAAPNPSFEERMERFGQEMDAAGQRLGHSAEDAGRRLAANPTVAEAADTAARVWGLIVLAIGLWFFAQVTLGLDMPSIPLRDLWPLALIGLGLLVIGRGMVRRRS